MNDGDVIGGTTPIGVMDDVGKPDSLGLSIDGAAVPEDELARTLERAPYFVFEVNQMNYNFKNSIVIGDEIVHPLDEDSSRHIIE